MTNSPDFTAVFKDMMGSFPVDTKVMDDAFKSQSSLTALDAANKSTALSAKWTTETLGKFQSVSTAKSEPADYAKSMSDFATASAEAASGHMAAFAEIAKKVQTQTMELVMAAGKDASEEMTTAAKKATTEATAAVKKAAAK